MAETPQNFMPGRAIPAAVIAAPEAFPNAPSAAALHIDEVAAENLIRTTAQVFSKGGPTGDLNALVKRNVGEVIRSGSVAGNVIGDIITTVESAKGGKDKFDWNSANLEEKKAYLISHGLSLASLGLGGGLAAQGRDGSKSEGSASGVAGGGNSAQYSTLKTAWDPATGGVGLSKNNFASSPFPAAHLDLPTAKALLAQGFNPRQVVQAGNDTHALGLNPKVDAAPIARLNRDAPAFMPKAKEVKHDADDIVASEGKIVENDYRIAEMRRKGDNKGADTLEAHNKVLRQKQDTQKGTYATHQKAAIAVAPAARRGDATTVIHHIDDQMQHNLQLIHQRGRPATEARHNAEAHPTQTGHPTVTAASTVTPPQPQSVAAASSTQTALGATTKPKTQQQANNDLLADAGLPIPKSDAPSRAPPPAASVAANAKPQQTASSSTPTPSRPGAKPTQSAAAKGPAPKVG